MTVGPWNEPPTYGIKDPQEEPPVCFCDQCGREIYPGTAAFTDDPNGIPGKGSVNVHDDCLMEWVEALGIKLVAEKFDFVPIAAGGPDSERSKIKYF